MMGYRITCAGKVFGYTSDVQINESAEYAQSVSRIGEQADLLVQYFNAFDFDSSSGKASKAEIVAKAADRLGIKTLVTTHHGPAMDRDETRMALLQEFRKHFGGNAVWGEDGLTFSL